MRRGESPFGLAGESPPQVGAPDPGLKTSPIIDEADYDEQASARDLELEAGACWFNGRPFRVGACVRSGGEVLQCSGGGVWVRGED